MDQQWVSIFLIALFGGIGIWLIASAIRECWWKPDRTSENRIDEMENQESLAKREDE
jgi:hypothetical protein